MHVNESHWVCVVVLMADKEIKYYDSLDGDGSEYTEAVLKYLRDEALRTHKNNPETIFLEKD